MMPSVVEINQIGDLDDYRSLWNSLLPKTTDATFFQSLDWLEAYWRHHGRSQTLRVLIVSAADGPIGILPLVVRTERTQVGRVRVLTYPLHDWGTFYGPIGPNPAATLLAGLQHVRRAPRDWDLLDLRWVDATRSDFAHTGQTMRSAGFPAREQVWSRAAVVEMSGTWDEYWNGRPRQWREDVDRLQCRLADRGEVTHVCYRPKGDAHGDGDPRWDLYEACTEVARKSWQGSSTTGTTLSHRSVAPYLRDTHVAAARSGALDLNLLLVGGTPAAFAYNYRYGGSVYELRTGFDRDLAAFGPGTVLKRKILEESFRRGDRLYDQGTGCLECERSWQTSTVDSYHYTHFPVTVPRAQLLRAKRWLQHRFHAEDNTSLSRLA
ncbi:MAG: GNAT family N-acetyltransferase [Planctomycetes bacterium]|nr:GNAT family N-acetyltransferase [Planctomycetota bacterium]